MQATIMLDNLVQDGRFAFRQLRKSPAFAVTAILTLALGMCASVAIFAYVDAALIKPLPYLAPSTLVAVYETTPSFPRSNLSYADYLDWKRLNVVFTSLAAYQPSGVTLSTAEGAERAAGARVSDDFFKTLGVEPVLGRDFHTGEDLLSAPRTVILSYAAWQKRYGGNTNVLGQTVTLNGFANVIIGVLPQRFHFAPVEPAEFWTTLHPSGTCDTRRSCHNMYGVARLRDGISVAAANANMVSIAQALEKQYPDSNRSQGAVVIALTEAIVGNIRPVLKVLLAAAGLLLFIASVNVACLLLVRSQTRSREMSVRIALGASVARVMFQFVTEGLVLVTFGTALGLTAAYWTTQLLMRLIPANMLARMSYLRDLGLNARVLGFAAVLAALAALFFAVTPMLRHSWATTRDGLAEGSRGSAGTSWRRLGSKLVVVELATAMVLLVGAALLGQSLYKLLHVNIGMQADHLASLGVAAPNATYSKREQRVVLGRELLGKIAALPGVRSAAIASTPPLYGGNTMWIRLVGRPYHGEQNDVHYRAVSPAYFTTLGARLLQGRYFTDDDDASRPPVVIVNQALARKYFPEESALGKQILYTSMATQPAMEIVGVIDDVKEGPLDAPTRPTMYVAFAQDPTPSFSVLVRTSQAEQAVLPTVVATIRQFDPGISTYAGTTMTTFINNLQSTYIRRSAASLVGGFAAIAWLLGIIGLYGVIAYAVSQRTREIGVRMALGAGRLSVYHLILSEAGRLTIMGIVFGVVASIGAATLMSGLLFGVGSTDVPTLVLVAVTLGMSALAASYIPARRAASISPIEALRTE
jgi:predicted permease